MVVDWGAVGAVGAVVAVLAGLIAGLMLVLFAILDAPVDDNWERDEDTDVHILDPWDLK